MNKYICFNSKCDDGRCTFYSEVDECPKCDSTPLKVATIVNTETITTEEYQNAFSNF